MERYCYIEQIWEETRVGAKILRKLDTQGLAQN